MSTLGTVLKSEMTRLARKELKIHVDPIRKANAKLRTEVASLKRTIRELERNAVAGARLQRKAEVSNQDSPVTSSRMRVTSAGIKTMRAKLGLSAEKFGKLVGATGQTVYNWEADENCKPTGKRLDALIELRGMGKREVMRKLEALA